MPALTSPSTKECAKRNRAIIAELHAPQFGDVRLLKGIREWALGYHFTLPPDFGQPLTFAVAKRLLRLSNEAEWESRGIKSALRMPTAIFGRNWSRKLESKVTMADDHTLGDIVRLIDGIAESTQAGFNRLESRLDRLDATTDELRTSVESIDRRLIHMETRIEDIEERVALVQLS